MCLLCSTECQSWIKCSHSSNCVLLVLLVVLSFAVPAESTTMRLIFNLLKESQETPATLPVADGNFIWPTGFSVWPWWSLKSGSSTLNISNIKRFQSVLLLCDQSAPLQLWLKQASCPQCLVSTNRDEGRECPWHQRKSSSGETLTCTSLHWTLGASSLCGVKWEEGAAAQGIGLTQLDETK